MKKSNIIKRVIQKLAKKAQLGSFYILNGVIYYNTEDNGKEHPDLWKQIVLKCGLFDKLVYENKMELIHAQYATDRGRVTWQGLFNVRGEPDFTKPGNYMLYGTPGCKEYASKLKSLFSLTNMPEERYKEDWKTDGHYKVVPADANVLKDSLKLMGIKEKGQGNVQINIPVKRS